MAEAATPPSSGSPAFCTVVAKNYLAHARALARSLRQHHPGVPVYVLLVDDVDGYFDPAREAFQVLTLADLDLPRPREFCFRYDVLELSTAVKPFLFRRLFERGHRAVVFLDPDIWVFRPLDGILGRLGPAQVLLTPHLTAPVVDGHRPGELEILLSGAYNLGFLGLARGPEVDGFLDWWSRRCETTCVVDPARGLFVDQRWMDLVPGLLDRVEILRDPGYNVAYWNLAHRPLDGPADAPTVDGSPVRFFHFSGLDPLHPTRLSRHQDRFLEVTGEPLFGMLRRYSAVLLEQGYQACRHWPYSHGTFRDGHPISKELRQLFREQAAGRFPDPFDADAADAYVHWATAPSNGGDPGGSRWHDGGPPGGRAAAWMARVVRRTIRRRRRPAALPPLAARILERRPDLRAAFTPDARLDTVRFLRWLATDGLLQHQLKPAWCRAWLGHAPAASVVPRLLRFYDGRPDLRQRLPMAFVEEHDAHPFHVYLGQHPGEAGLDAEALSAAHGLFEDRPVWRIREILAARPDVRRAFPAALHSPGDPDFLAWLRESGRKEYGIHEDAVLWFERARAQHVCWRLRALHAERDEWRRLHPCGLTTFGRAPFLTWLKAGAAAEAGVDVSRLDGICPEEDRTVLQELRWCHAHDPRLRGRFPRAFEDDAETQALVAWLRAEGLAELGVETAWRERLDAASPPRRAEGATAIGYLRTESGMGELARATVRALRAVDYPVSTLTLEEAPQRQADLTFRQEEPRRLPATILHVNAPETWRFEDLLAPLRQGGPVVGYWAWELDRLPDDWSRAFRLFDEVWTCSRFAAAAVAADAPVPVQAVWPSLTDVAPSGFGLADLGLDPSRFTFLFLYDFLSESERKNPLGLIEAFRRAFPRDGPARLLLKTTGGALRPAELARMQEAAEAAGAVVLDQVLDRRDVLGLVASCHAYASLHRAEGFGFTLAEAMALGKPVVATLYSGNADFMGPWNSYAVPFRVVEIEEDRGPYTRGMRWADPDLDAAAAALRAVHDDPDGAAAVAARGRADVLRQLSPAACGARIAARLRRLLERRP
jgi:glycosyltransferase involved in cell wall biosynthesis